MFWRPRLVTTYYAYPEPTPSSAVDIMAAAPGLRVYRPLLPNELYGKRPVCILHYGAGLKPVSHPLAQPSASGRSVFALHFRRHVQYGPPQPHMRRIVVV